ncbi:potassium transporter 1 isoform X2 [Phoenix dactylifera]|uniref:Potassium transporter n=1 Tax=Phoenix dactylifera TaxID=42345 RepID=A0A8B9A0Y2_PHODC|nr:potassium transporter 1 isoform X2 [Phoenix dactylifera]
MSSANAPSFASEEGSTPAGRRRPSCKTVLTLAYQSLGVVYGDLSTSPLYVYKTTFSGKLSLHEDDEEVFGVLSFIFWTLTLIPLFKYIYFVLSADDNGEDTWQSSMLKELFKKHPRFRNGLLIVVLLGTCMTIGDGVLTPAISVLSAVSGVGVKITHLHENYIVAISCAILVGLFSLQHHGTHRVGFLFAPIVTAWLLCISGIGIYNIFRWNQSIIRALSPLYMFRFLKSTGIEGWVSLGGVVLCITGAETMFANLGHFSPRSIKMAFSFLVYPCLILAYMGEAAFLSKHHEDIQRSFYKAIPEAVFWPVFVVATLAAIVGSQAVISATFSIISQCCSLSCFPRVKIVHTSNQIYGQIYIPEVNWILMCLCLAVTIGLRNTNTIGHAYGFAVTIVIFVTTCLMSLVIIIAWKQKIMMAIAFLVFFGSIELLYISASFIKIPEGGWIPIVLSMIFMSVMYIWNYGTLKKHEFDLENKVSVNRILVLGPTLGMVRVPGIGLVYGDLVTGVPAVFGHFATNLPAFHQILVFVCIKSVQVPFVSEGERFLIGRIGPKEFHIFRCIVRYGYKDLQQDIYDFENILVSKILAFVEMEDNLQALNKGITYDLRVSNPECPDIFVPSVTGQKFEQDLLSSSDTYLVKPGDFRLMEGSFCKDESLEILKAKESGVVYILGHSYARAKKSSSLIKKFVIDVIYAFLSKNCRGPNDLLNLPHSLLLEVGMNSYV